MMRLTLFCTLILACQLLHGQGEDPFGGNSFGGDPFGSANSAQGQDPFADPGNSLNAGNQAATGDPFGSGAGADSGFDFPLPGSVRDVDSSSLDSAAATGPSGLAPNADPTRREANPVVRLLREQPPETPDELADGLNWMVRIQRWDEVRNLLDTVNARNWSLEQKAQLSRRAGTGLWMRLRADEVELTDAQKQLVGEILRAPSQLARQPETINRWIDQLGSDMAAERRLVQLRLQDAGSAAVEGLVSRLLAGDDQIAPVMLAGTASQFGEAGDDALRAACGVDASSTAARILLALADLPGKQFTAELAAGLESRRLTTADRSELSERLLKKYGRLPSREAIVKYLDTEFDRRLFRYFDARRDASPVPAVIWRLGPDGDRIQALEVPSSHRPLELLAQLARLRQTMPALILEERIENAVAILQQDYQSAPRELSVAFDTLLPPDSEQPASFWQQVFDKASEWQLHGAAVNALRALSKSVPGTGVSLDFASRLLRDPRPVVRYSALEMLFDWNVKEDYPGAEQALQTAFEMVRLGTGPQTLVIGLQSDLRQAAQQQIQQLTGAEVTTANSARAALLALNGSTPIELILIVDRVSDQSLFELLQRIRKSAKGSSVPIAVLTDELYPHERRWIAENGGVLESVLSRNLEQMRRVYEELLNELDTEPLSPADRALYASVGKRFLARIAADPEQYDFYPIHDFRDQLTTAAIESPTSERIMILSGLGSAASQSALVEMVADPTLLQQQRVKAANAFRSSVKRFGNQLGREGVLKCYDLYNRFGPNDPIAVRGLGHILDVIEAYSGRKDWPTPL